MSMLCRCFFYGLVIVLLIMDNKEARGGRRGGDKVKQEAEGERVRET